MEYGTVEDFKARLEEYPRESLAYYFIGAMDSTLNQEGKPPKDILKISKNLMQAFREVTNETK